MDRNKLPAQATYMSEFLVTNRKLLEESWLHIFDHTDDFDRVFSNLMPHRTKRNSLPVLPKTIELARD